MAFSYVWMLWGRLRDLSTPSVQPWGSMGGDLVDPMICAGREVVGTAALQVCSLGALSEGVLADYGSVQAGEGSG